MNHGSNLWLRVFFYRETSLTFLSSMMCSVNKSRNGKGIARKWMKTRNICMRSAFARVTFSMHHPPFLLATSRNELPRQHHDMITKTENTFRMFGKFAADIGIAMNQSKDGHQVGFVGLGSVTSMRMLHKEGPWPGILEKLCPTQRVLGTLLIYSCSNVVQRQARFRAA